MHVEQLESCAALRRLKSCVDARLEELEEYMARWEALLTAADAFRRMNNARPLIAAAADTRRLGVLWLCVYVRVHGQDFGTGAAVCTALRATTR